jgi:hypothetical protein
VGKLVWRVKLVVEAGGPATEVEVARIEREDWAVPETLGLSLDEGKRVAAAIQAEMVRAQASTMSEHFRSCGHCGLNLSSKGYRSMTFRSLFGNVPLRVRRFVGCRCQDRQEGPKSFSALALEGGVAPETCLCDREVRCYCTIRKSGRSSRRVAACWRCSQRRHGAQSNPPRR